MRSTDYLGKSAYRGEVAARYDEDRAVEAVWSQEQEFVRAWVETLRPGGTVLDIPAGTGRFLELFLARGLQVLAQDISEDMLAEIRRRHPTAAAAGLEIRVGDAEQLALPDGAVDHLVCWRFFHLIPLPVMRRVLREFHRVCRGTVVVQVFAVRPETGWAAAPQVWRDRLRALWRRVRPARETAAALPWSHIASFSHRETVVLAAIAGAGFAVRATHTLGHTNGLPTRVYFLNRADGSGTKP
jgi:ubiquinone/menaquinone biosynthesis C-methylase UbiE